jgi:hypothetical protein
VEDSAYYISTEDWIATLVLISESSKKLLEVLRGYSMVRRASYTIARYGFPVTNHLSAFFISQECSFVLQQLLASARAISASRKDNALLSYHMKSRSDGVRIELATTACKVLRTIEGWLLLRQSRMVHGGRVKKNGGNTGVASVPAYLFSVV